MPSPLKSPAVAARPGYPIEVDDWEGNQLIPGVEELSIPVPITALPLLLSRKETVPVGAAVPPISVVTADNVYAPQLPLSAMVVVLAKGPTVPVTVSADAVDELLE
jgi:hypothetical protein